MKRKICGILSICIILCCVGCVRNVTVKPIKDITTETEIERPITVQPADMDIRVWVPPEFSDWVKSYCDEFMAHKPSRSKYEIIIEEYSLTEASKAMIEDLDYGGDVYCYNLFQQKDLVRVGALYAYEDEYFKKLTKGIDKDIVEIILEDGELYGCHVYLEVEETVMMIGVKPQSEENRALLCIDLMQYITQELREELY